MSTATPTLQHLDLTVPVTDRPPHTVEATWAHLGKQLRSLPSSLRLLVRTVPKGHLSPGGLHLPQRRFFSGAGHLHGVTALVLSSHGGYRAGQVVQFSRSMFLSLYELGPHDHVGSIPLTAVYGVHSPTEEKTP